MMGRGLLLVALLALAAVIVDFAREDPMAVGPAGPEAPGNGYYIREAKVTEFGEDGRVTMRLQAGSAVEDPARAEIGLTDVRLDYYALPGQRWRVTARSGLVPAGYRTVELEGDVIMRGERDQQPMSAVVRTERLTLDTDTQRARTDAPVVILIDQHALQATGLQADLKAETLRLESRVNGRFLP